MKPIGLQMYTLRDKAAGDAAGTFKAVADAGYKGVEFAGFYDKTAAEMRKLIDDLGLTAISMHTGQPTEKNIQQIVDDAGTLGCRYIVSGRPPAQFETPELVAETAASFQASAELAARHGLVLCYHNHSWEMIRHDGAIALETLLDSAPALKSEMDIFWTSNFGVEDAAKVVADNAQRIPLLHVKDGPLVKEDPVPMSAVGKGKVDIDACVKATDPDVLEWLIVEQDMTTGDILQDICDSYNYLVEHGLGEGNK